MRPSISDYIAETSAKGSFFKYSEHFDTHYSEHSYLVYIATDIRQGEMYTKAVDLPHNRQKQQI